MYNIPKELTGLYLKAVDIMKKLEAERTEYEKRIIEVYKKYSLISVPGFLTHSTQKEDPES